MGGQINPTVSPGGCRLSPAATVQNTIFYDSTRIVNGIVKTNLNDVPDKLNAKRTKSESPFMSQPKFNVVAQDSDGIERLSASKALILLD